MKHFKLLSVVFMLVLVVCLAACGGEADGTVPETEASNDTGADVHEHASSSEPIRTSAATCSQKGYTDYRCDECQNVFRTYTPTTNHVYKSERDSKSGLVKAVCTTCGDERIQIDGAEGIDFAAYCRGALTIDFEVSGDPAEIEFVMDDEVVSTKSYEAGAHSVVFADAIAEGEHTFSFNCKSGTGMVDITNIDVNGTMNRPNAVILEMDEKKENKGSYGDFFVYVQTSDPSGEYYIRYNFAYEYSNEYYSEKADTTNNIDSFRIEGAQLVHVDSVSDTEVKYESICKVLHQGEVFLAIKESGTVDFIGGFHGDEHIVELELYADGIPYVPGEEKKVVTCSYIELIQTTVLNRCNMPAYNVANHFQVITIDSTGIQNKKTVEWLVSDFKIDKAYLQMFTMYRLDGEKTVCDTVKTFNAGGVQLGVETVIGHVAENYNVLTNAGNRRVEYSSEESGISAEVGFEIIDQSVALNNSYITVRMYDDNKWYADFRSVENGNNPEVGETWKIEAYYNIDYIKPGSEAE